MREFVSRQSPVTVDVNVLSITGQILVLGESPVHHGVPGDVVALVGVYEELQPDIMKTREEVESVPGSFTWSLLTRSDLEDSRILQGRFGDEGVGEDGDGVYGRSVIVTYINILTK